jgi:hypothetical protein
MQLRRIRPVATIVKAQDTTGYDYSAWPRSSLSVDLTSRFAEHQHHR